MSQLVKPDVIAADFGVKKATVMKWVRERRIPHVRVTNETIRFDREAVRQAFDVPAEPARRRDDRDANGA